MNVEQACRAFEQSAYGMAYEPKQILSAGYVLLHEVSRLRTELVAANAEQERLENQLDSVRSELVATCARMQAWEDVIDDARDNLSAFLPFDLP